MDISYNHCRQYRVDIHPDWASKDMPHLPWEDEEAAVHQFVKYIEKGNVKYYLGKLEYGDKTDKPHFQMCMWFDEEPQYAYYKTNIQKKPWVRKGTNVASFTIRRKKTLEAYVVKDKDSPLITNMTEEQIAGLTPWVDKKHCKGCNCQAYKRTEYIIKYLKKLLKDKMTKEIIAQQEYKKHSIDDYYENNEYESLPVSDENYIPSSYECKVLMAEAHKHYFEKYDRHICRSSLIKIMLKVGMITHQDYISKTLGNLLSDEYV